MTAIYKIIIWISLMITLRSVYSLTPGETLEQGIGGILIEYIRCSSEAFILSLPLWLPLSRKPNKTIAFIISYLWILILSIIFLSNIWYARHYGTPVHYTDIMLVDNLNGLGNDIYDTISYIDFLSILPVWCTFLIASHKAINIRKKNNKSMVFTICGIIFSVFLFIWSGRHNYEGAGFSRTNILKHYGIFHLLRYDINANLPVSKDDIIKADKYLEKNNIIRHYNESISMENHNKYNLIVILMESFASWPIEKSINRTEITPYINRIIKSGGTGYWPNMVPQTKDGRSSDAQLIINTGLLPVKVGAVAGMYANHTYPSLPKALKSHGYESNNFICDGAYFWNQKATSIAYGFDKLYDKYSWHSDTDLTDSVLFEKVKNTLSYKNTGQPYYSQIVTISSHCPYNENNCPDTDSPFLKMNIKNKELAYYLSAIHYTDRCIGNFIKWLKLNGIDKNTVIVITGDHEDVTLDDKTFIPFIMIHPQKYLKRCDDIVAQSDIYTTLLDAMDINDYFFYGLGFSLLDNKIPGMAISRDGKPIKDNSSDNTYESDLKTRWEISDIVIRSDYFRILSL